jgi:nucleoside-diphosphate-sugar epimerase
MRVFVAGASGAIGRRLVPQLLDRGHEVVGSTRSEEKAQELRDLGAEPVMLDVLDEHAVQTTFAESRPDAVVHEATALSGSIDYRHFDRGFAKTNRLRTAGTDTLLAAARAVGARRFVAQSFTSWPYARVGGPVKTEEDPLDPDPPSEIRETLAAIRHLEQATVDADGIALRYGGFYGSPDDAQIEAVRKRRFPIVGAATGSRRSFISRTPQRRPCSRSNRPRRASTTWSTTSLHLRGSGCRCSRLRWAPSRRGASRPGSPAASPVMSWSR